MKPTPITIIFADDHPLVRDGFAQWISKQQELKLLAMAASGEELLQLVRELQPEIVITDIRMRGMDGIQATAIIKRDFPSIQVMGFTGYNELGLLEDMLKAGASGYALKYTLTDELLAGIKAMKEGRRFFCCNSLEKLLEPPPVKPPVHFTKREVDVMLLVSQGLSNKAIAKKLGIGKRTVEFHRANVYAKTGTKTAMGLGLYVRKYGLDGAGEGGLGSDAGVSCPILSELG